MDVKTQQDELREELHAAALKVLDSGVYILGPEVKAFEAEFAKAQGAPLALGVSSGTDALQMALTAVGVGPGDEVIVPTFTFIATATVVSTLGAKPVLADVDPMSLTLDCKSAASKVTKKTKAILPVHLYGYPADMDPLLDLAKNRGLRVVEDCAQAHLAMYKGRHVGALGDLGAFSFYPTKNLGAAGDGGLLTTADRALFDACSILRDCGRTPGKRYEHKLVSRNCRLDELQAALLRVKLRRLEAWTKARHDAAAAYREGLKDLPLRLPPPEKDGTRHSYHLFVVQVPKRDAVAKRLADAGVGTGVYYPIPVHLQPAYAYLGHKAGDFPEAERACSEALALPMYPGLTAAQVGEVCAAVRKALS